MNKATICNVARVSPIHHKTSKKQLHSPRGILNCVQQKIYNSMLINNNDYNILYTDIPVLTRQENGQFEFRDCYLLEFVIKTDSETMDKIKLFCTPFDFNTAVKNKLSTIQDNNIQRLFLLAGPNIIKNRFQEPDDFLALALCDDGSKSTTIQYFEVNNKFRHSYEPNQKYKRVGTSAVQALQKIYPERELCGESALYALKFWDKNGFTRIKEGELYIRWRHR